MNEICVIGAGLAGSMVASLLSKLRDDSGDKLFRISVYEKRDDPRKVCPKLTRI